MLRDVFAETAKYAWTVSSLRCGKYTSLSMNDIGSDRRKSDFVLLNRFFALSSEFICNLCEASYNY